LLVNGQFRVVRDLLGNRGARPRWFEAEGASARADPDRAATAAFAFGLAAEEPARGAVIFQQVGARTCGWDVWREALAGLD
jgi:hypothetical protein